MAENNKIYITANELAEMLGVSVGHAYKLIRKLNQELEKEGFDKACVDKYLAMFEEITNDVIGAAGYGRIKILDDYHIFHI